MKLILETKIVELYRFGTAGLSAAMARRLAEAVAVPASRSEWSESTVGDLLEIFPRRYEDRSHMMTIDDLSDGDVASIELFSRVAGGFRVGRNRSRKAPPLFIFEISASDFERTRKPVVVWWFVSGAKANHIVNYWKEQFENGTRFVAYGKWEWDSRRNTYSLKLNKPDELEILPFDQDPDEFGLLKGFAAEESLEVAREKLRQNTSTANDDSDSLDSDSHSEELALVHVGRRVPIYRKLGSFQTKRLREIIFDVLEDVDESTIIDQLPLQLRKRQKLISRGDAIREIHFPPDDSDLVAYSAARSEAHKRLIFEEFFHVTFSLRYKRGEIAKLPKGANIEISPETRTDIVSLLPFELTDAQKRVAGEVFGDMESDSPMNRLIQGDVGSGKTIIAFLAMFVAIRSGYQVALMAPTEVLAEQHLRNAKEFFEPTGYNVELLIGGLKVAEKRRVYKGLIDGNIDAIIGTHAIIQDSVEFKKLGLAVIDEQHRFGVVQRAKLREQSHHPDVLVMTATPIPRSLAMTVYGDLFVSVIDELPPGRTPIKTVVVGEDQRKGVYRGIEREIKLGRQVYIVYPLIEESEKLDLKAATMMHKKLCDEVFPNYEVGLLHGKMKTEEKDEVMTKFVSGKLQLLVSTTVIEVGVDVPNASLMVIEHAERFGLSQLHQLRGRVGRGAEQSYCLLLSGEKKTEDAKQRLGIMEKTSDGFLIAEKDLEIRGQGDILGTRQSGLQTFKLANIVRDLAILEKAREEAEKYLGKNRGSKETLDLIRSIKEDPRFYLADVG